MENIENLKTQLVDSTFKHVAFDGLNNKVIAKGAESIGLSPEYGEILFPGGIKEMLDYFARSSDSRAKDSLASINLAEMKIRQRIHTAVKVWIGQNIAYRPALKRASGFYLLPNNSLQACKHLWHSVDQIWTLCGDQSTDYNYYSKRLLLAGVFSSTYLHWLNDYSHGQQDSWDFLERRINNVLVIGQIKTKLKGLLAKI